MKVKIYNNFACPQDSGDYLDLRLADWPRLSDTTSGLIEFSPVKSFEGLFSYNGIVQCKKKLIWYTFLGFEEVKNHSLGRFSLHPDLIKLQDMKMFHCKCRPQNGLAVAALNYLKKTKIPFFSHCVEWRFTMICFPFLLRTYINLRFKSWLVESYSIVKYSIALPRIQVIYISCALKHQKKRSNRILLCLICR